MITNTPRIEEPEEEDLQEDGSSISTTRGQVGSPISSRTRSLSGSDSQQAPLTSIPEDFPAPEPEEQGSNAYLSPQRSQRLRPYRHLAPRAEVPQTQPPQAASSSSSMQAIGGAQQEMSPQRQLPSMMPYFEREAGPWSPNSPTDPESRKRALSAGIPDLDRYHKDRPWGDKMQDHIKKIEQGHGGQESSDEEKKRLRKKRRMGGKRRVSTRSMTDKKHDRPGKDDDRRGGGQGGEQTFMAS